MPWILEPENDFTSSQQYQTLKRIFIEGWPEEQRYTRLFALGVDAYHLVYNVNYLHENPYTRFAGATGNLQMDENNRISRHLLWAKIIHGEAVYIEPKIEIQTATQFQPHQPAVSPLPTTDNETHDVTQPTMTP